MWNDQTNPGRHEKMSTTPFLQTNFAPLSHLSTVDKLSSILPVQQPPFYAAPNGHSYKIAKTPLWSNQQNTQNIMMKI